MANLLDTYRGFLPPEVRGLPWRTHPMDGKLLLFERDTGLNALLEGDETAHLRRIAPRTLLVAITNACNLTCDFCYRDLENRSLWRYETLLDFCRAADEWGVLECAFGGGEPMLFPRWAEFIKLDVRPFVTLSADLRESDNPTDKVLKLIAKHDLDGAVVRLLLDLSPETETRFNENTVKDELKRVGVYQLAGIRKQVEQTIRARLGASPEGLTNTELLERYFLSKEIAPDRRQELLAAAEAIFEQSGGINIDG